MKITVQNDEYGTIVYEESAWSGKKNVSINGTPLKKIDRKRWSYEVGGVELKAELKGNTMMGVFLTIDGTKIEILPKPAWYVVVLSILMITFVVVWGSSSTLVKIFPIVGGALGGAISGVFAIFNIYVASKVKSAGYKLLIGLGFFVATVFVCYLFALVILGLV